MAKSTVKQKAAAPAQMSNLPEPRDFLPRLIRTHNSLIKAFEASCGIHIARWRLLYNLARRGTASQNELSRSTTMGPAAVTRILADMERKGQITRRPSKDDHRQVIVELTREGEKIVMETAAKREKFLQIALAGFSDAEIALLERLLGAMEDNLSHVR